MSGGYFDYEDYKIDEFADQIERVVNGALNGHYDKEDSYSDWQKKLIAEGSDELKQTLQDAVLCLRKAAIYTHRIDWLFAGDDGPETFIFRLKKELDALENNQ